MKIAVRETLIFWFAALGLVLVSPMAAEAVTLTGQTTVPAAYSDLYTQLNGDLNDFQSAIAAVSTGPENPISFAAQLTSANCNNGPSLLNASSMTLIQQELAFLQTMGVQAVSVEVSFPMLNSTFLGSSYSQWVTFYGNVAAAVRAAGFKLIVESQSMIPSGLQSTAWGTQLQTFYPTMNFNQYVTARASTAAAVATTMKPDYFVVQEEPDTESNQAGQPEAGTAAGSTTMLNASHAAVAGLVPGMKVGAGFGSWLAAYQEFADSFTRTGCSTSQPCVSSPLDFLDMHLFPVIENAAACSPTAQCPPGTENFWQNAMSVVATAKAVGIHMTISQAWLRKVRDSEWPPFGGSGDVQEAREAYDFWAPLDQQFLEILYDLATYQGMYWIAPFNTQNFSAYLQWSNANSISGDCGSGPSPCGTLSPSQVFADVQSKAITALQPGSYTSTGLFWHDLIVSGNSGSSCSYNISSSSQSFTSNGGAGNVTVTPSGGSCTWIASSNVAWITVTNGSSGAGSGTVSYSVDANTSGASRTGTLTIGEQTFTVTQPAAATYSISGTVTTSSGSALSGVTITLTGTSSGNATTDSNGNYAFTGLSSGSYTITTSLSGYAFSPLTISASVSSENVTGENFTGTQLSTSCNNNPASINGTTYSTLQAAYSAASNGANIKAEGVTFTENPIFNRNISITLQGGYDCSYSTDSLYSPLNGTLTISNGTVTVSNLIIQGTATSSTGYTITASAGTGGSISPSGTTTVQGGGSQAYTITASSGYAVSSVLVDGSSVGAVSSYTFSNVTANHTVSATFTASPTYSIISGTVSTFGATAISGVTITLTQNGTAIGTTTTDNNGNYSFTGLSNGSYTITPSLSAYTFSPSSTTLSISSANLTGQNFTVSSYDCNPATGCQQLSVSGDTVNTNSKSVFYGNLDPCIRRDPNGNNALYFMYSFPLIVPGATTPTIEIHLASSTDHGATWNFLANVWPYVLQPDGNYSSHEVSNLAAQNINGTTTWFGISHYYEVPPGGSSANPQAALYAEPVFTQSTQYVLSMSSDPAQLGSSPTDSQVLICGGTTSAYASLSNPNLTTISGDSNAVTWREPALLVQGDILYLAIQAAGANGDFKYIGIFAARISGKMSTWQWKYLGKLFNDSDPAQVLPSAGNPNFTEIDLTQKPSGQIIAIFTAQDEAIGQKYGSRTAEVSTLGDYDTGAPPAMVRDSQGNLIITGQFTANDLNVPPNQGPGASTYEAMEPGIGVLIVRRDVTPSVHGFTFNTGQHP